MIKDQDVFDLNMSFYGEIIALFDSDPYCCRIPPALAVTPRHHPRPGVLRHFQHQDLQATANSIRDGEYGRFISLLYPSNHGSTNTLTSPLEKTEAARWRGFDPRQSNIISPVPAVYQPRGLFFQVV